MADAKTERLGLRGTLALVESALRLVGAANATGAISAGAAFHALGQRAAAQGLIKTAAIIFLGGVMAFALAYFCWFMTAIEMDQSLDTPEDKGAPERALIADQKKRPPEQLRKEATRFFWIMAILGLLSLICFMLGMVSAISMALSLVVT
jgi:hypothetical protein